MQSVFTQLKMGMKIKEDKTFKNLIRPNKISVCIN